MGYITEEQHAEVLARLDRITPIIEALGAILVRRHTATERVGLNKNTISANENIVKYDAEAHRRTYIEIGEISVIKQRKRNRKRNK